MRKDNFTDFLWHVCSATRTFSILEWKCHIRCRAIVINDSVTEKGSEREQASEGASEQATERVS